MRVLTTGLKSVTVAPPMGRVRGGEFGKGAGLVGGANNGPTSPTTTNTATRALRLHAKLALTNEQYDEFWEAG